MPDSRKVGIIPAAGMASRFKGILKELLPLPDERTLLQHAIDRLWFCDDVIVVSNPLKLELHKLACADQARLVIQEGLEIWGAIKTALAHSKGDHYYMTMADTWMMAGAFDGCPHKPINMGYFQTDKPEKFGVILDRVIDKPRDIKPPVIAWGVVTWSDEVVGLWEQVYPPNFPAAINVAMDLFETGLWSVGHYYDCANAENYYELWSALRDGDRE
jgi:hypothetical protein